MKKIKILILVAVLVLLCGCGKASKQNVLDKFENKINSIKSYSLSGTMDIISNEDVYTYDVKVDYQYNSNYKVTLTNSINDHTQIILKNNEGVFVVTPALNKSYKFQSNWPETSSQSYLLQSIVKDINDTPKIKVQENKGTYIAVANVNYPNNKKLSYEKIILNNDAVPIAVEVYDDNDNLAIKMTFNKVNYSVKFENDNFKLDTLITTGECEQDCEDEKTGLLDDIIYPLYVPEDTVLTGKDIVETSDGERVILTFSGSKPFMIIEERIKNSNELEVTSIQGEPLILSTAIGALTPNSLEWTSNNVDYYLTSTVLSNEEMLTIAESLNTLSVIEIKNDK